MILGGGEGEDPKSALEVGSSRMSAIVRVVFVGSERGGGLVHACGVLRGGGNWASRQRFTPFLFAFPPRGFSLPPLWVKVK